MKNVSLKENEETCINTTGETSKTVNRYCRSGRRSKKTDEKSDVHFFMEGQRNVHRIKKKRTFDL